MNGPSAGSAVWVWADGPCCATGVGLLSLTWGGMTRLSPTGVHCSPPRRHKSGMHPHGQLPEEPAAHHAGGISELDARQPYTVHHDARDRMERGVLRPDPVGWGPPYRRPRGGGRPRQGRRVHPPGTGRRARPRTRHAGQAGARSRLRSPPRPRRSCSRAGKGSGRRRPTPRRGAGSPPVYAVISVPVLTRLHSPRTSACPGPGGGRTDSCRRTSRGAVKTSRRASRSAIGLVPLGPAADRYGTGAPPRRPLRGGAQAH